MSEFLAAFHVLFDSLLSRERSELGGGAKPHGLELELLSVLFQFVLAEVNCAKYNEIAFMPPFCCSQNDGFLLY